MAEGADGLGLQGRVVLVTGAASGIGAATCRGLLDAGARLVAVDRDADRLRSELGGAVGRALLVEADVATEAGAAAMVERCRREHGRLDGLLAAAAIGGGGAVDETAPAAWDEVVRHVLTSVYLAGHFGIPLLRESGGGSFVAIASQMGIVGARRNAAYCAAKGGVVNLVRAMALDHAADNIRVNAVCPGPFDTPMLRRSFERSVERPGDPQAARQLSISRVPMGRLGEAREIADVVLFLLSPRASFVTGAAVLAEGGWGAQCRCRSGTPAPRTLKRPLAPAPRAVGRGCWRSCAGCTSSGIATCCAGGATASASYPRWCSRCCTCSCSGWASTPPSPAGRRAPPGAGPRPGRWG
jgi:NAD(P)-dependent dehydrogenase (short-subunit alcohol dehydrogenase family)